MLFVKALHIIFVITWFAGLFYIVRLFIYYTEAESKPEPDRSILKKQFGIMMKRLWYGITWPSMILTIVFGFWFAFELYGWHWINANWLLLKLSFVALLVVYHLQCGRIYKQLVSGVFKNSSFKLRLWNEAATLLLVIITFTIVLKDTFSFWWGIGGIAILALLFWIVARVYRNKRRAGGETD